MKTRTKILLTILAAILYWLFLSWLQPQAPIEPAKLSSNAQELAETYKMIDENYFDGNLPKNVVFSYVLNDPKIDMAETTQISGWFKIAVDPKWMSSDMVKEILMLHEACHVYIDTRNSKNGVQEKAHGRGWRACMTMAEARGAFRDAIISGFRN